MNHEDTRTQRDTKQIFAKPSEKGEWLAKQIVDISIKIYRELGPGLLESVYAKCFYFELFNRNITFEKQKDVPIIYQSLVIDDGLRLDLLVEDLIIVSCSINERWH